MLIFFSFVEKKTNNTKPLTTKRHPAKSIIVGMSLLTILKAEYPILTKGYSEPQSAHTIIAITTLVILFENILLLSIMLYQALRLTDEAVLFFLIDVIPKHIPAAYSYLQILIFFRVFLCITQSISIKNIYMHRMTTTIYKCL